MLTEVTTHEGEMKNILCELSELQIPFTKVKDLAEALQLRLNGNMNYWPEMRQLFRKIGNDVKLDTEWLIDFKINWPDQMITCVQIPVMIKENDKIISMTVKQLKSMLGNKIGKKIDIEYFGELLNDDETLLCSGLLPQVMNNIKIIIPKAEVVVINEYGYETMALIDENEDLENKALIDELEHELQKPVKDKSKIKTILDCFMRISVPMKVFIGVIPLIRKYLHEISPYQAEMRVLMQRYGYYMRRSELDKRSLPIKLDMVNYGIEIFREHFCVKVRKIRKRAQVAMGTQFMIILLYKEQQLDDDEYLIDCGCNANEENCIIAIQVKSDGLR